MTLFGDLCYSNVETISGGAGKRWPEPTPWFRELLEKFKHDPVEWNTQRYRKYRRNQMAKKSVNSWPADLELAFQRALRLFGGYGRDKKRLGTKLSGCNEWIAWCIFVESGTELSRKQISSHLQVLKKLLSDNNEWMLFARPLLRPERVGKRKHRRKDQLSSSEDSSSKMDTPATMISENSDWGVLDNRPPVTKELQSI